jgi:hypothetical protein
MPPNGTAGAPFPTKTLDSWRNILIIDFPQQNKSPLPIKTKGMYWKMKRDY